MSLQKNTTWNLIGTGAPLIVGAFSIPFLIGKLGTEAFGILSLVWVLIGYFSIFDFGLGRALTLHVALARQEAEDQISGIVKAGLLTVGLAGVIGLLLLINIADNLGYKWMKVSFDLQETTILSLKIAAFGIPMATITTGLRGVLEGFNKFKTTNILRILLGVANFGVPAVILILFGNSLELIVFALIFSRLIVAIVHMVYVNKLMPRGWLYKKVNYKLMKKVYSFGAWNLVSNIVGPLMVHADKFLISISLGASVVAYYTVPFEILIRILIIPSALTTALFPVLAGLIKNNIEEALRSYKKCLLNTFYLLVPVCIASIFLSEQILHIWIDENFANEAKLVFSILAIGILFNGISFVPFTLIQATGNARTTSFIHLSELIFYVPILMLAMNISGLVGAAFAWSFRAFVDLIIMYLYASKIIKTSKLT